MSLGDDACNTEITPVVRITNVGTNQLNTVQVAYQLNNNEPVVYNWGGFLSTGQTDDIELPAMETVVGENTFTVTLSQPNGVADENPDNDTADATFNVNMYSVGTVEFALQTDNFGSDTSWQLTDAVGNVLYNGSNYSSNQSYSQSFTLAGGCYVFTINDSFGDGICCASGNGSYSLSTGGNVIIEGGDFETSESVTFSLNPNLAVTQPAFKDAFKVYPNPSSGIFNIIVNDASAINYQLYNMLGQTVAGGKFAAGESKFDITSAANGIYMLQVTDANGKTANFKLVKE